MARKNLKARVTHAAMVTEQVIALQEKRRSGGYGTHDTRPKSQRTRANAKRSAIREYA